MAFPLPRWLIVVSSLLVVCGAGAAGALWWTNRDASQHLQVFYSDSQAMFLVPIEEDAVLPPPSRPEAWAAAVLDTMRHAPNKDVTSLVTPEVKLLEARWHAPTWTLHVAVGAGRGSEAESLLVGSVVRTFVASYPGAESVEIRLFGADGKPYLSQHLDLSKPLTAADFSNRLDAGAGMSATLWWAASEGGKLVPVQVALKGGTGSPPRDAFKRLLSGPPNEAGSFLKPVVPAGLVPEWSRLEGGVATINLNRDLPADADGEHFIEATVLTLTEFEGVKSVQFVRDGLPMPIKVGDYQLDQPIARPLDINGPVNDAPATAMP